MTMTSKRNPTIPEKKALLAAKEGIEYLKEELGRVKVIPTELLMIKHISYLCTSVRTRNCLLKIGIKTIGHLIGKTWGEIINIRGLGVYSYTELREHLRYLGFIVPEDGDWDQEIRLGETQI